MANASSQTKKPFFARFFAPSSASGLEAEKARLEAFLNALPGEYCGFDAAGNAAYSPGFSALLGVGAIKTLADIQDRLSPSDAAALESLFTQLQRKGAAFTLAAKGLGGKTVFKFSGAQGADHTGQNRYDVLWVENITAQHENAEDRQRKETELKQLQIAMNSIPRPLWLRDAQQNIVWCNTTYAEFLNTRPEDAIRDQKEITAQALKKKTATKDDIPSGRDLAAKALGESVVMEMRVHAVHKGSRLLMKISEIPLKTLEMTLGIAYNVTREEELESELKRYQSSNKELMGQLRSAIAIYSADERLEFYNAAFAALWGLEDQFLNTRPRLAEIMEKLRETRRLPEQADFRRFKQTWLVFFTSLIEPHEDMLYLPDGTVLRMLAVPHSMGGLMMTFEDVTSRLELESSYNTLIAVQKETLDNLAEAVAVYGGDGRLKLWNPAFSRLWGLHPEDLEGEPHISKLAEKMKLFFDKKEWPVRREELIAKGLDRLMHEGRMTRADGTLVDFSTVPLPDGGVLVTYTDVTDSVRVENALREKNAALEAAEQLKLDFLANVSYQLRTPLNAIMGFTEILHQEYFGPLNERQKDYTRDMKEASERLLNLINDILDLSTLEAGYMTLQRDEVKIGAMLENVLGLVSEWARKQKIAIDLKCPKNIGTITADERRLQQALINIIRNAITFTPSGGSITLTATRKKTGLEIAVTDTGIGISKEDRIRIFEPFERAQSGSAQARVSRAGAGLGLSLVKNIVALHGGTVDLDSAPGKGTTVTLFLPFTATKTDLKLPIKAQTIA